MSERDNENGFKEKYINFLEEEDENGDTVLSIASEIPCTLEYLVNNNRNLNKQNKQGDTALHLSVLSLDDEAVRILSGYSSCVDPFIKNDLDFTPLQLARHIAQQFDGETVKDIIVLLQNLENDSTLNKK